MCFAHPSPRQAAGYLTCFASSLGENESELSFSVLTSRNKEMQGLPVNSCMNVNVGIQQEYAIAQFCCIGRALLTIVNAADRIIDNLPRALEFLTECR